VLVGGWPASGKTTLARVLADELRLPYLSKDEVKEALMDALGTPATVAESRRPGTAAVHCVLRVAAGLHGAVIDSTWFDYARPLVDQLPGVKVEVRCLAARQVVQQRFAARQRDPRHLDVQRAADELWAHPAAPLGVGPLVEVDTNQPLRVTALTEAVRAALSEAARAGPSDGA
jgi:predicted kinase